ncbi:hypothetical protein Ancab_027963, partial [Ancistrocladus abbreviatus]
VKNRGRKRLGTNGPNKKKCRAKPWAKALKQGKTCPKFGSMGETPVDRLFWHEILLCCPRFVPRFW